ncbi:MAG: hypothetical protein H6815_11530 [Phycisphaeraceae bacterium]|nr:hypothetical protein [Phycisphaerales bacterium]MCB9861069.1 hypothetical protein [Phycisphaeraceae bacterium]
MACDRTDQRRYPWKRCVVCVLLGVCTAVLLAWGAAVRFATLRVGSSDAWNYLRTLHASQIPGNDVWRAYHSRSTLGCTEISIYGLFVPVLPVSGDDTSGFFALQGRTNAANSVELRLSPMQPAFEALAASSHPDSAAFFLCGYPMRCMWGYVVLPGSRGYFAPGTVGVRRSFFSTRLPGTTESAHLPLRVLWGGMFANIAIWTAAWGVLMLCLPLTLGFVRGVIRTRRGACARCGYDLRGLAGASICPECGMGHRGISQ